MQAQQGGTAPSERQVRTQALNDIVNTAIIAHYAQQHGIKATTKEVDQRYNATKTGLERQAKQPVRLDHFQAFVQQGGRIDSDLGTISPGWVLQGISGSCIYQGAGWAIPKGAA